MLTAEQIHEICEKSAKYFASGATRPYEYRKAALEALYKAVSENQEKLSAALKADLNKSSHEAYMTETGIVLEEIRYLKKHLKKFMRVKRVSASFSQFPASVKIIPEPYGTVLIMSPWNYPVQLTLVPLATAIAAGNTVVLKPSAYSPETGKCIEELLNKSLPEGLVLFVNGGRNEIQSLLDEKFDYIFFTGSPKVGHIVMEKAAAHITPMTLELGGKSPVIIDESADLDIAVKRLCFGKLTNAGQTCVAPDYVLVHNSVEKAFLEKISEAFKEFMADRDYYENNFPKIINKKQYDRLSNALDEVSENIVFGGEKEEAKLKIAPCLITNPPLDSAVMTEEIFGPLLPVISYSDDEEMLVFIAKRPRPLALYHFTSDKEKERLVQNRLHYGGGCVNDCLLHMISPHAPFGGIGASGMGHYHGAFGFNELSHMKTVLKKSKFFDVSARYHPFDSKKEALIKKVLR